MSTKYTIGLDYGTNSVRALIVNVANGAEVASAVWGYSHVGSNVIDTVVRSLRKKLGERASMIETVRGRGYRLRADVT